MNLDELAQSAAAELAGLKSPDDAERFRIKYLGTKGLLKQAADHLRTIPADQKRAFGQQLNVLKSDLTAKFETARKNVAAARPAPGTLTDVTEPGCLKFDRYQPGSLHLINQTIESLTDLFSKMGFAVASGPELEDEFHNFDALNVPATHPARDPLDNFYLDRPSGAQPFMLRSQTSSVQIRVMERHKPPIRIVAPGRVYRPDTVDATHSFMFHQLEGLVVDTDVTMVDLKTCIDQFARGFFGSDVQTRFRPSYFPFTEPSAEFDVLFHYPDGSTRWIELGGCGMVDPAVFAKVGIDTEIYTGFAFGLGIERVAMRRHGVTDIRSFYENDIRFLAQF
ncbi:MAG: phenylalanine--tRNA ligase subunit alpha [Phycisphaerales bacterium]|nr:phenylalanine--tRNA ligase subunit alpha [Phycisphaerales bacterium]